MMRKLFGIVLVISGVLAIALWYCLSPAVSITVFPSHAILTIPGIDLPTPTEKPKGLKVVTYNIGYASGKKNNLGSILSETEVRQNLDAIVQALTPLHPDLVALEEVDFKSRRSFDINQMEYLARGLQLPYAAYAVTWSKTYLPWPYWPPSLHFGRILSGQVLLSRYPLTGQTLTLFPKPAKNPFWYNWFYLDRILQKITVQLGNESAVVWLLHLEAFDKPTRLLQAQQLGDEVKRDSAKIQLVLGDFNSVSRMREDFKPANKVDEGDQGEALQAFVQATGFSNAEQGEPFFTMPSWDPNKKIDHIFYSPGLKLKSVGTVPGLVASDHLPVWADLQLP